MSKRGRRTWLCGALAGLLMAPAGCAHVQVSSHHEQTPAGPPTITRGQPGSWAYTADVAADRVDSGTKLRVTARRRRTCEITVTTPLDDQRVVTRRNTQPRLTAFSLGLGLVSATVAGVGLSRHLDGQPLCTKSGENSCEFNTSGTMVLWGSVGTIFLITGIYDLFAATDSSDHLGVVKRTQKKTESCGDEPAAGVTIAVRGDQGTVTEGLTDQQGHADLLLPAAALDISGLALAIDDTHVVTTPVLAVVLGPAPRAPRAAPAPTSESPGAAPASATPSIGEQILPASSGAELTVVGVPLRGARREALQPPLEQAGAQAQPDAKKPHVARFDLGAAKLPALTTLEILFDKDDRFIGAKFSGATRSDDEVRLLELLRQRCGPPEEPGAGPRKRRWSWKLPGEMDMTLAPGTTGAGPSLVIRDLAAARNAKARSAARQPSPPPF